jgi:hypothetical protein
MNSIVIAAHGCPVGCLGPYGNEWIATPNLDQLAANGITFDRHYARHPDSLIARQEWWSAAAIASTRPPTVNTMAEVPSPESSFLIRATRAEFDAPQQYYARFAEVFDARPDPADETPFGRIHRLLPKVLDSLAKKTNWLLWIETDRLLPPWFVPVDIFDIYCEDILDSTDDPDAEPLQPWDDPPTGRFDRNDSAAWELLHRSFATAVTAFDADLGRMFDLFTERGLDRTAAWAFTSDFGYPLGEHGIVGPHRPWLYEEFVHLPLIVRRPNAAGAGRRIWRYTQPAEVLPLVSDVASGLEAVPVISRAELHGYREAALRNETHALLVPLESPDGEPSEPRLFEKPDDRWEINDVRKPNLDLADELEAELRRRISGDGTTLS